MIVLNKKRVLFIIFAVMLAFCIPIVPTDTTDTIQTVALPVSNKVIVLDAGHRKPRRTGLRAVVVQQRML